MAPRKRVELLALCRKFEKHGLTNSGSAAARFVVQTEGALAEGEPACCTLTMPRLWLTRSVGGCLAGLQPAEATSADGAGFERAVAQILSERQQQDRKAAASLELAFEARRNMALLARVRGFIGRRATVCVVWRSLSLLCVILMSLLLARASGQTAAIRTTSRQ